MTPERYPLAWPAGQRRTTSRKDAAFQVDLATARDQLIHSVELLGGRHVVLSTNIPTRRDGLPLANAAEPIDPGVAVYFDRRVDVHNAPGVWKPFVIACDTYRKVKWNLRAIGATVEALRAIQRHGASSMLEQAFTGFAALPPATTGEKAWWDVLGVTETAGIGVVRDAYRELARIHHPDAGGSHDRMAEINRAYAAAKQEGRA